MIDDSTLLRRYLELRDEAAFAELVGRHVDGVYSMARRRVGGDHQLAADVAQEVFLTLVQQAHRLTNHPTLVGWLYTTTRNIAVNLVRAERRRFAGEQEALAMQKLEMDATGPIDWSTSAPLLEEALDTLPASDRLAVLMRFIERRPFAEIGAVLSLSEEAARKRVERTVEKLRAALARRGILCSTAALSGSLAQAVGAAPAGLAASIASHALASATAAGATVGSSASLLIFLGMSKLQIAGVAAVVALGGLALVSWQITANAARPEPSVARTVVTQSEVSPSSAPAQREKATPPPIAPASRSALAAPTIPAPTTEPESATRFVPMSELTNRGRQTPADALTTFYWATWSLNHEELAKSIVLDPAFRPKAEEVFAQIPAHARERLKVRTAEEMYAFAWAMEMNERWTGLALGGSTLLGENQAEISLELQAGGPDPRSIRINRLPLVHGADGWQGVIADAPGPNHLLDDIRKKFLQGLLGQKP